MDDLERFERKSGLKQTEYRGLDQPWTALATKSKKGRAPRRSVSSLHIPGDVPDDEHDRELQKIYEKNPDYTSSDDSDLDIDMINDTFEARLGAIEVEDHALRKLGEGVRKMDTVKKLVHKSRSFAEGTLVDNSSASFVSSVPTINQALSSAGLQFDEEGKPIDPMLRARDMGMGHYNFVKGKLVMMDPITGEVMNKRQPVDVMGKKLPPKIEEVKRKNKSETDRLLAQIDGQLQSFANEARGHINQRGNEVRDALRESKNAQMQKRRKKSGGNVYD